MIVEDGFDTTGKGPSVGFKPLVVIVTADGARKASSEIKV